MGQDSDAGTNGKVSRDPVNGPKKFDIDLIISHMPEVGHFDSEGYTVLPEYYDDDVDYSDR